MSEITVIIGASSGVGRALCDQFGAKGHDLVIAARQQAELELVASEVRTAFGVNVTPLSVDVAGSETQLHDFIDTVLSAGRVSNVIITAGTVDSGDDGLENWAITERLIETNMTGVIKLAGRFAAHFERESSGTIVLLSSIAAGAPRRRNVAYAAAKAGLESFGRSLQHRFAGSAVAVQIYRLGYVDTRLTRGLDLRLPPADPNKVAKRIANGLGEGSQMVYLPRYWGGLVRILRLLPRSIYNRLDF